MMTSVKSSRRLKGTAFVLITIVISYASFLILFHRDLAAINTKNIYVYIMDKALPIISTQPAETISISSGSFAWPVTGTITSHFGPRGHVNHEGIDIAAPYGTPVCSYMDGTVTFSGWKGGYGYLIIIDHGNGVETYYGHNSRLLAYTGQHVILGQHIAEVGSTGDSTGPHSHFEIRFNGIPADPLDYLK